MNPNYTWEYTKADGRWEQEVFRTLYTVILKLTNDLAIEARPGTDPKLPKILTASPAVVCALESLEQFRINEAINMDKDVHAVGHIGRLEVYRDLLAAEDYIIINAFGKQGKIKINGLANART